MFRVWILPMRSSISPAAVFLSESVKDGELSPPKCHAL